MRTFSNVHYTKFLLLCSGVLSPAPPDMEKVLAIFAKYEIQVLPTPGM
jgi:hypothetical protein